MSNKICALSRDEAKDVADLIFLSMKYAFTWETMINYARQKDKWVNVTMSPLVNNVPDFPFYAKKLSTFFVEKIKFVDFYGWMYF